jgi:hypothetical protein
MEYNENPNEINESENENEDQESGKMKQWLQDNLRIIISVVIVVVIAAGIYSYSNRTITPEVKEQLSQEEQGAIAGDENAAEENGAAAKGETQETAKNAPVQKQENMTSSTATSQETDKSFVETAARGDGTTKLARRALANYLEKNPDSALTPEHKIYIEDYLRKNASFKGRVSIGTSVEFSKDLINQAISKSKSLNQNQLKNLHKYAVRVPSLT